MFREVSNDGDVFVSVWGAGASKREHTVTIVTFTAVRLGIGGVSVALPPPTMLLLVRMAAIAPGIPTTIGTPLVVFAYSTGSNACGCRGSSPFLTLVLSCVRASSRRVRHLPLLVPFSVLRGGGGVGERGTTADTILVANEAISIIVGDPDTTAAFDPVVIAIVTATIIGIVIIGGPSNITLTSIIDIASSNGDVALRRLARVVGNSAAFIPLISLHSARALFSGE